MSEDWGWYFTSAERRTSILRDELEAARSSAAQTSRLTSQLRTLQGSLESRLNALSRAFDAYVELGDIREQLAGYPDTTVVRRDVAAAIDALAGGRIAQRVDDRGQAYWLPHAANAVIGIASGAPDLAAEQSARDLSPDAELFVVAACGALDQGPVVADRLAPLLVCDGALNDDQLALWQAAVAGRFGPVLPSVHEVWSRALDYGADLDSWRAWCHDRCGARDAETAIAWIAELFGAVGVATSARDAEPGPWSPGRPLPGQWSPAAPHSADVAATASSSPGAALRGVVARLVARGTDQEAPLLDRARELRRRIENPVAAAAPEPPEPARTPVVDAVRSALIGLPASSPQRAELLAWVAPVLRAVAEAEAASLASLEPVRERVRTADGDVAVTAGGPESDQVERARNGIATRYPDSVLASGVGGGLAVILAISAVVGVILGSGWAFLAAIMAIAAGMAALRAERGRRERIASARAARARLDDDLAAAEQAAIARIDAREITRARVARLLEFVRSASPAAASAEVAARTQP